MTGYRSGQADDRGRKAFVVDALGNRCEQVVRQPERPEPDHRTLGDGIAQRIDAGIADRSSQVLRTRGRLRTHEHVCLRVVYVRDGIEPAARERIENEVGIGSTNGVY